MDLKFVTLTYIFFLSTVIVCTKGDATMLSLIKSLKDTQELLEAYNDGDYLKMTIKLIDVKLIADPPEKGSYKEELLLSWRKQLLTVYPYYHKIHEGVKNPISVQDIKNLEYEEIIEQVINRLDNIMYEMEMSVDNLQHDGSMVKPIESKLQGKDKKVSPNIIKMEKINNSTEQLSKLFDNFTGQVVDAFSQTVDRFSLKDDNKQLGFTTGQRSIGEFRKICRCENKQNCNKTNVNCGNKPNKVKPSGGPNQNNGMKQSEVKINRNSNGNNQNKIPRNANAEQNQNTKNK